MVCFNLINRYMNINRENELGIYDDIVEEEVEEVDVEEELEEYIEYSEEDLEMELEEDLAIELEEDVITHFKSSLSFDLNENYNIDKEDFEHGRIIVSEKYSDDYYVFYLDLEDKAVNYLSLYNEYEEELYNNGFYLCGLYRKVYPNEDRDVVNCIYMNDELEKRQFEIVRIMYKTDVPTITNEVEVSEWFKDYI